MITSSSWEQIIKKIVAAKPQNVADLSKLKRRFSKEFNISLPANSELIKAYKKMLATGELAEGNPLEKLLVKRKVRTLSGVAPITVLTKPFPCPGQCVYCPTEPNMPKSYLSNEPAAMRAVLNKFDPFNQVTNRLQALTDNGHHPDKIDLIILGGTWSSYPKDYQKQFIHECFRAANNFGGDKDNSTNLADSQTINETARYRLIGICIETRPDQVVKQEIKRWREYGVTRIQLGAQHLDDKIQVLTKRGHTTKDLISATQLIKDAGFKLDYHLMQNLPGSTPKKDLWCVKEIVTNPNFQPDQIKLYPTIVNKYAELASWYQAGKWQPYSNEELVELLLKIKTLIPYYIRINRIVRDFPKESIQAGNAITNLREMVVKKMAERHIICRCIRCREAKYKKVNWPEVKLFVDRYPASGGEEIWLNYASSDRQVLYAFCRLRLPTAGNRDHFLPELRNAALIRELHTFGTLVPVTGKSAGEPQHLGFGKKLMSLAEAKAKKMGYNKIAVISGIGVRAYYYRLGYQLTGTYLTKKL